MLHQENRGSCDGSFRDTRYFMCDDGYGAFLPASRILTPKKLLVASTKTKTDQDFYLDDPVVVFDKDGRRVPGVAKWAVSGKEHGVDCYIIGIETVRAWVGTDSITSCVHNSCSVLYTFSNCNGPCFDAVT